MARAFYPYELQDPDLEWLLDMFFEFNGEHFLVQQDQLPLVLIKDKGKADIEQTKAA